VEIDTGTASFRMSIATLVSSVVSAYTLADQTQNSSLGLNSNSSMPTLSSTNYIDGLTSHMLAIKALDTQLGVVSAYCGGTTYTNNYLVTDGDDYEAAISKLDAGIQAANTSILAVSVSASTTGATRLSIKLTPAILDAIYNGTAKNIVDLALGATGRYAVIHDMFVDVDCNSSAHVSTGSLYLCYSSTYGAANVIGEIPTATINAATDTFLQVNFSGTAKATNIKDQDIYLVKNTGSLTTKGDTNIYLTILYSTISRDATIAPTE